MQDVSPVTAILLFVFGTGGPLAGYVAIMRMRATTAQKLADADVTRSLAVAEAMRSTNMRLDMLETARERDRKVAEEWRARAMELEARFRDLERKAVQMRDDYERQLAQGGTDAASSNERGRLGRPGRHDLQNGPDSDRLRGSRVPGQALGIEAQRAADRRADPGRDDRRLVGRGPGPGGIEKPWSRDLGPGKTRGGPDDGA